MSEACFTATVKWFSTEKGYGFAVPDRGGNDIFLHIKALERSNLKGLTEGQRISYEEKTNKRSGKIAAENIKVLI